MNGAHDCGGKEGFGAIAFGANEQPFADEWERRAHGILTVLIMLGCWNLAESRRAMERIQADEHADSGGFEHYVLGMEALLVEKGILTRAELAARKRAIANGSRIAGSSVQTIVEDRPRVENIERWRSWPDMRTGSRRFDPGDHVIARNINPLHHTRLPGYVRGKTGIVIRAEGILPFPDTIAHGGEPNPQHVYLVEFSATELWGEAVASTDVVRLDLWDAYLDFEAKHGRGSQGGNP